MSDVESAHGQDLFTVLGCSFPAQFFTDNKCLFEIIFENACKSEEHIVLDIAASQAAFYDKRILVMSFVRSLKNMAYETTKSMIQDSLCWLLCFCLLFCKQSSG